MTLKRNGGRLPVVEIETTKPGGFSVSRHDPFPTMARSLVVGGWLQPPVGWTRRGYTRHVRRALAAGGPVRLPRLVGMFREETAVAVRAIQ